MQVITEKMDFFKGVFLNNNGEDTIVLSKDLNESEKEEVKESLLEDPENIVIDEDIIIKNIIAADEVKAS